MNEVDYLRIYEEDHIKKGLSYGEIQEKYNIPRGTWDYYIRKKFKRGCDRRKYRVVDNFFDNIDSELKSYLLGFLYGDGFISNDGRIGLLIQKKDEEVLKLIKENVCPESPIRYMNNQSGVKFKREEQASLRFKSKRIYERLVELGFSLEKTSKDCDIFCKIPDEYKKDFIRGFSDTDGNIRFDKSKKGNYFKTSFCIVKGNSKILIDISNFLRDKGIYLDNIKEYVNKSPFYVLSTSKIESTYNLLKFLYDGSNYSLDRKKNKAISILNHYSNKFNLTNTELTSETKESEAV